MFANPFYKESSDKTPNQDPEGHHNTSSQSAEKDVLADITEPSVDVSNITDNQKQQFNNPFGDQQADEEEKDKNTSAFNLQDVNSHSEASEKEDFNDSDDSNNSNNDNDAEETSKPAPALGGFKNPYKETIIETQKQALTNPEFQMQEDQSRSTAKFGQGEDPYSIDVAKELGIQQQSHKQMNESYNDLEHDKSHTQDLLSDVTESDIDASLNQSGIKMMMNNPLGLNQSYLNNKSDLDVSRSKLNYSGISQKPEVGLDRSRLQGVQFNIDPNREFGQEEIELRVAQFDEHMLSHLTEDTVDLSHMSMPKFKNQFYQKDNSLYLNMTGLDVSNISAMKDKSRSFVQNKTQEKSVNKSKYKENKEAAAGDTSANILGDLYISQNDISQHAVEGRLSSHRSHNKSAIKENVTDEPRETANFHEAPKIDNEPRPTGQFGLNQAQEKSLIKDEKSQNIEAGKSIIQQDNEKAEQSFGKEEDGQAQPRTLVHAQIENEGDISQIMGQHPGLSRLDISKISIFEANRGDDDEFIGNVTANNVNGFLSASYMRGSVESDKKEDGTDVTLEFHQNDVTPEKKSLRTAAELDQPKIQEVSLAKEETQMIEESVHSPHERKENKSHSAATSEIPQQTSFAAEPALPEAKQRDYVSKSFVETRENIQESAANKSYNAGQTQAIYNKYSNPFTASENNNEIFENRLTLGQAPIEETVKRSVQVGVPVAKGINKSYEYVRSGNENEVKGLNKSYHNPFDAKPEVQFDKSQLLLLPPQQDKAQEAPVQSETNPQSNPLPPDFNNYVSEMGRFTFQRPGVDPTTLERSFELGKKVLQDQDKLSQSFDFMAKAGAAKQFIPPTRPVQAQDNSYIFNKSKSVSDLNISQGPIANAQQFANPLFNAANDLSTSQIHDKSTSQIAAPAQDVSTDKIPLNPSDNAASVINRIFEGFTLGPRGAVSTNQSFEAKDDALHKSFDNAYGRGTLKERPEFNYETKFNTRTLREKIQSEQQNQSCISQQQNAVTTTATGDKSLSRIGLAYLQDEDAANKSVLSQKEGDITDKSVSRIGLGYLQDEDTNNKSSFSQKEPEIANKSVSRIGLGYMQDEDIATAADQSVLSQKGGEIANKSINENLAIDADKSLVSQKETEVVNKSVSRIGLGYMQDEDTVANKSLIANKSVSRIGLGYMQDESVLEGSETKPVLEKSHDQKEALEPFEDQPVQTEVVPIEETKQEEVKQAEEKPIEIKIPLRLKKKERSRPQILTPKGTIKLPEDVPYLIDMVIVDSKDKSAKRISYDNLIKQYAGSEKNTRKKFLGFKLKKEKFVRAVNERKITSSETPIEPEFTHSETNENDLRENFVVHESLDRINLKLQDIRRKLDNHKDSHGDPRILLNFDKIIVEDNQASIIEKSIAEIEECLQSQPSLEEDSKLSLLMQRGLLLSKQKHSKIDLVYLDNQSLFQLSQQNQRSLEGKAPLEILYSQAEQFNKVRLQEGDQTRYIRSQYNVNPQILTEIRSDVDVSDEDDGVYQASSVSNAKPLRFDRSKGYKSNSEAAKLHGQKMKFYSAAVNIRLDLPPGHPGRELDIGQMYNECLEKNIGENEWNSFLNSKFQR